MEPPRCGRPGRSLPFSGNAYFFLPVAQTKSFAVILAFTLILTPHTSRKKNVNMFLYLGFITLVDILIRFFFLTSRPQ